MEQCLIIGVDVSKETLDFYFKPAEEHLQIANTRSAFNSFLKAVRKLGPAAKVLIVMEHTGMYSYRFELFLQSKQLPYCKLSALEIKRSIGMVRGKSDKVDAERIAQYAWLRRDHLQPDPYRTEIMQKLRMLLSRRQALVKDRTAWKNRLTEEVASGVYAQNDPYITEARQIIEFLSKHIKSTEMQLFQLIKSDQQLHQNDRLLRSEKGVGPIIAAAMIVYTDNFSRFSNARKFNCYAGFAPFKHESGTSIRGASRVSHLANKNIKGLLSMGASCAIQHDPELKAYYTRRINEGKMPGHVLNIIKAKMVSRMFAIIKRQTPYQTLTRAA